MTKYILIILLSALIHPATKADTLNNEFEAELRLLEANELVQDAVQDTKVENLIQDRVNTQSSATSKKEILPELVPVPTTTKKTRRVPSR
ncbi:MAG: hypothetical protein Q7U04_11780 [Bacteriovorax sp.]|nr:hypothetical protein [Bacteriovorax sp.]